MNSQFHGMPRAAWLGPRIPSRESRQTGSSHVITPQTWRIAELQD